MLIVHIAQTPLAGAPIRITNAINQHTRHNARFININPNAYGERTFPEDLSWQTNKAECLKLIKEADILHIHHFMDIESDKNPLNVNLKKIAPDAKIIRHFHSNLPQICKWLNINEDIILNDNYQKTVIPHCAERTFLHAPILPNIIPINDKIPVSNGSNNGKIKVAFSSSSFSSRYKARWDTKGYIEVSRELKKLSKKLDFEYIEIANISYHEAMKLKQDVDIVIGDIVTGSYHLTELEGLAQGKVVLSYLDARTIQTLINTFDCKDIPFVNVKLEYIEPILKELINNKQLREDIGKFSREWIEKYYSDKNLIQSFIEFYEKILNNEKIIREESEKHSLAKDFLYNKVHDLIWEHDKNKNKKIQIFSIHKTPKQRIISLFGLKIRIKNI